MTAQPFNPLEPDFIIEEGSSFEAGYNDKIESSGRGPRNMSFDS
jgi:hypothetical protein